MTFDVRKELDFLAVSLELIDSKRREIGRLTSQYAKSEGILRETMKNQVARASRELVELVDRRINIMKALEALQNPVEKLVIQLYYLDGYDWNGVSARIGASTRTAQNLRNKGIKHLKDTFL